MPNKTLSLAMVIFISAVTVASSFAVLIPQKTEIQVTKRPQEKLQSEVKEVVEKNVDSTEPVQKTKKVAVANPIQKQEQPVAPKAPEKAQVKQPPAKAQKPYRRVELPWRDIQLLAHMVQGEARGEPFIGKVAVASVVINRLQRPNFPDTVAGIIYGAGEFCTVRDGQINLPPNSESYRAVQLALGGWDPSYGSLYFYNPARSTSKWIFSRPIRVQYGQHVFAG